MYELTVMDEFAAAHQLRNYGGDCERLHGHNWKVEVMVKADELDRLGMVIDFRELKEVMGKVISYLDHQVLNHLPEFKDENPTSENIARYIFKSLAGGFDRKRLKLHKVVVWETDSSWAGYAEDEI